MQAMNGPLHVGRKRGRILGSCVVLALALCGLVVGPAVANGATTDYLAAGDSISFGYTQEVFVTNLPNDAPSFFEEGFDKTLTTSLDKATEVGKGVVDVNTACPGETSNGFIGENTALGGETSTEPNGGEEHRNLRGEVEEEENEITHKKEPIKIQGEKDWHPCAYHSVKGLPLHYSLTNGKGEEVSQLEELLSILREGSPAHPVRAITLNIGSNDELAAISTCKHEIQVEYEEIAFHLKTESQYGGHTPQESFEVCVGRSAEKKTFPHIITNIGKIVGAIDSTSPGGGHYKGAIILMGFYNPDAFVLPGSDRLQEALNEEIENHLINPKIFPNMTFANPMPTFNKDFAKNIQTEYKNATTVDAEQDSICQYTEMCNPNVQVKGGAPVGEDGDIHPSLPGNAGHTEAPGSGYKTLGMLANKSWVANPAK
jgi:hypothetical protein